ncbi:MAG: hypothetical protein QG594_534 [Bacteroidota bacterium]|nr:hypothetical protein [Bacteroidota bacterium]
MFCYNPKKLKYFNKPPKKLNRKMNEMTIKYRLIFAVHSIYT